MANLSAFSFVAAALVALALVGQSLAQSVDQLWDQSDQYFDAGDFDQAIATSRRALATATRIGDPFTIANSHWKLASALSMAAKYDESNEEYRLAEPYFRSTEGPNSLNAMLLAIGQAFNDRQCGRFAEAKAQLQRCLVGLERSQGANDPNVAYCLNELGRVDLEIGRYADAEGEFRRAANIRKATEGSDHYDYLDSLNNLALAYTFLGRYADAEPLYRQVWASRERTLGPKHPDVANSLFTIGELYRVLNRHAEALPLLKRCLAIREEAFGADHPQVAVALNSLGVESLCLNDFSAAESLLKRSILTFEKSIGVDHIETTIPIINLGNLYVETKRFAEADELYARALAVRQAKFRPENAEIWPCVANMARSLHGQARYAEALAMSDRAVALADRFLFEPSQQGHSYFNRARTEWKLGQRDSAIADLERAMDLAEQHRASAIGGEQERASAFADLAVVFETMVDWRCEMEDAAQALAAMERARARSLLDEMRAANVDLDLGRPAAEIEALRRQEADLTARVKAAEHDEASLADVALDDPRHVRAFAAIREAQMALYDHWRTRRSTSPVYRHLLETASTVPDLDQVRSELAGDDGLLLAYLLGEEGAYVVTISKSGSRVARLSVETAEARTLGIDAGPLTAESLHNALMREDGSGVLQLLSSPATALSAVQPLAALWRVVVPEATRGAILDGAYKQIVVLPDGPLALLPFETLVVNAPVSQTGGDARYLLDVGASVVHGPSATVLMNLRDYAIQPVDAEMPVLSIGNPAYRTNANARPNGQAVGDDSSVSRYVRSHGSLVELPFSEQESAWVKSVFDPVGLRVGRLSAQSATEAAFRAAAPGREIVHVACHGLTDNDFGNFFGALALTPGPRAASDERDDGFLTLAEIYALNLTSCELAILSACETNYGPQQKGEGTWALSRGFIVAGARRTVASSWLVDDEVAASLVSYFCGGLAAARKKDEPLNYAGSLADAKRWVRRQEKWSNPYYWGTFVMVGPN